MPKKDFDLSDRLSSDELENAKFDASKMAAVTLDQVIEDESETAEDIIRHDLSHAAIDEERHAKRILAYDTGRTMSRILFVTKDQSYLERESRSMQMLYSLSALFDEIHVIVLVPLGTQEKVDRVLDNLWVYRATHQFWWWLPVAAKKKAKEQLSFGGGFRPDIIVGLDPFESGMAAWLIAHEFDRPFQVHVTKNFASDSFKGAGRGNTWRARMAKFVLRRAPSIRTSTSSLRSLVEETVKKEADIQVLPHFYNFSSYINATPSFDLHEKYKDYVFIALTFGPLTADSHLHDVFSALNSTLHNPRIGLVVVGDGPGRKLFTQKVELLGLQKNVVFLSQIDDLTSYLKTADVLVETRTDRESEETVLRAAAAGLPLLLYETELRTELFKDGVSASICEPGDVHALEQNFRAFLNNQSLRTQYKEAAQHIVQTRLSEDETSYYRAYRDSIELALVSGREEEAAEIAEAAKEASAKQGDEKDEDAPAFEMKYPKMHETTHSDANS